jgi:hypothetical protein
MSVKLGKRSTSETAPVGLFVNEIAICYAPSDPAGNAALRRFAEHFVRFRFPNGELHNAQIGENHALALTDKRNDASYECLLGEYPFVHSTSSPPATGQMYYAEFPADSARLAAFMERCGCGEAYSRFARNTNTVRGADDNPGWVVDREAGIAYYLCFEMRGLLDQRARHVLFASPELANLDHLLNAVFEPPASSYRRTGPW